MAIGTCQSAMGSPYCNMVNSAFPLGMVRPVNHSRSRALICIWQQISGATSNVAKVHAFLFARSYLHLMTKSKLNYDLKQKFCPLHLPNRSFPCRKQLQCLADMIYNSWSVLLQSTCIILLVTIASDVVTRRMWFAILLNLCSLQDMNMCWNIS